MENRGLLKMPSFPENSPVEVFEILRTPSMHEFRHRLFLSCEELLVAYFFGDVTQSSVPIPSMVLNPPRDTLMCTCEAAQKPCGKNAASAVMVRHVPQRPLQYGESKTSVRPSRFALFIQPRGPASLCFLQAVFRSAAFEDGIRSALEITPDLSCPFMDTVSISVENKTGNRARTLERSTLPRSPDQESSMSSRRWSDSYS